MIRPTTPADAGAIADLHILAWQSAYRGTVSDEFLDSLSVADHTSNWEKTLALENSKTLVCETPTITGWICFGRGRDLGLSDQAEIFALYVDPAHWRSGIGRELLHAAERYLKDYPGLYLWVLPSNIRARRFYEAAGYSPTESTKTISWVGTTLEELRYIKVGSAGSR